ncbi:MAG: hypothetical protein ACQEST_11600 [Bacteroidota bacterium]
MKLRGLLLICVTVGLLSNILGCSTSGSTTTKNEEEKVKSEENWTLKDHIRRASERQVTGTGSTTRVIIRGESITANPSSQLLYVIDGQKAGSSFGNVDDMLYEDEISYIEVIPHRGQSNMGWKDSMA